MGYAINSWKALSAEMRKRQKAARVRQEKWKDSYGEVGVYPDLVKTTKMMDAIVNTLDEHKP
jgi:hypothetical protein